MAKSAEAVKKFLEDIVSPLGYEVLEVGYSERYGETNLTVYIGNDTVVTLDDCEKVHNAIDAPLDELDPTGGEKYVLNVSSYGIDRPIKSERDYIRAIGKEAEASLFKPVDGKKKYTGILTAYDQSVITLTADGKDTVLERKNIAKLKPVIRFE
ncbi:MAG: ribosome maturation factor RimP [Clostridiales bacterium]|jgi:ribosome maturation factor RimP|nr:ribosome maturation factor RimP [Clostridiales bacterium]